MPFKNDLVLIYSIQVLGSVWHPLATSYNGTLPSDKKKPVPHLQAGFVYVELLAIRYVFYSLII